jgi:hypothetical protein
VQTDGYGISLKNDITVSSSLDAATAYLLLYADSNDIPSTAEATFLNILAGASNSAGTANKM